YALDGRRSSRRFFPKFHPCDRDNRYRHWRRTCLVQQSLGPTRSGDYGQHDPFVHGAPASSRDPCGLIYPVARCASRADTEKIEAPVSAVRERNADRLEGREWPNRVNRLAAETTRIACPRKLDNPLQGELAAGQACERPQQGAGHVDD